MSDAVVDDQASGNVADRSERDQRLIEIIAAVVLGIAGILTAYAAYQSALTDGDALKGYTESAKSTSDANGWYDEYMQTVNRDQDLFVQYAVLTTTDPETAIGIRELLFSPELEAATVAWEASGDDGPATPLDMEEYVVPAYDEYSTLFVQAEEQFAAAEKADNAGDKFELAAVFLAVALFLAGVASLFKKWSVRIAVLAISVAFVVPGVIAIMQGRSAL